MKVFIFVHLFSRLIDLNVTRKEKFINLVSSNLRVWETTTIILGHKESRRDAPGS